jgi:diguanylate cyclase (GGDEF)-like protein
MVPVKRICFQLIVPVVLIGISLMIIWKWPGIQDLFKSTRELKALLILLPVLPYAVYTAVGLMGWRYNDMGLLVGAGTLALSYFISLRFSPGQWANTYYEAYLFLFPLNMILCAALIKRYVFSFTSIMVMLLLLLQIVLVTLFCGQVDFSGFTVVSKLEDLFPFASIRLEDVAGGIQSFLTMKSPVIESSEIKSPLMSGLPLPAVFSFLFCLIYLSLRFLKNRDILLSGYIGGIAAVFLSAAASQPEAATVVFHLAAGLILMITNIEASFFMAYHDELTGLPGRRRLNESLINLGKTYAIAMMDIDHFKKFNDRYGHKTGDDVLKIVGTRLKQISGRAKVFRYGGEEFAAIFPGKTIEESVPHLENFRKALENNKFVVRMKSRKKSTPVKRGLGPVPRQKQVKITISIGVAQPSKTHTTPDQVIKAADKALYKAKKAGRNRVCG